MLRSTRLGLMSGFLAMLLITFLYVTDPLLLVVGYERLTLLIFFGAIIYGVRQERQTSLTTSNIQDLVGLQAEGGNESKDFAPFSELLKLGFRTYIIGFFIKFFFIYYLFNYYDPQLIELVKEAYVKVFLEHRDPSQTEELFQQELAKFKAGNFGPSLTSFLGIGMELIMGFLMAFFTAIFFKREHPGY